MRSILIAMVILFMFSSNLVAAELTEKAYERAMGKKGVVIIAVNWSRKWSCGQYENAQLYELVFSKLPISKASEEVQLETNSKLMPYKGFHTVAMLIEPGTYALSEFDIKAAKSVNDIGHFRGNKENMFPEGKPLAGTFDVVAGEVVYIGHFYIDCAHNPMPWRFYFDKREAFEEYVGEVKKNYPSIKNEPIVFRLFKTNKMGMNFELPAEGVGTE